MGLIHKILRATFRHVFAAVILHALMRNSSTDRITVRGLSMISYEQADEMLAVAYPE